MSKWIDLPTNSWSDIEFCFDEPVAKSCLINHVDVVSRSLVMHAHPSISTNPTRWSNSDQITSKTNYDLKAMYIPTYKYAVGLKPVITNRNRWESMKLKNVNQHDRSWSGPIQCIASGGAQSSWDNPNQPVGLNKVSVMKVLKFLVHEL